jgi:urease accessory protein
VLTPRHHATAILDQTPAFFQAGEPWAAGASRLPNDAGLIYKIVGMETQPVRQKVREFWTLCRRQIVGVAAPRPLAWRS